MIYRLSHLLRSSAARWGDRPALYQDPENVTHAELYASARRLASVMRDAGVRPGDRIGLYLPKSAFGVTGIFAALELGAVYVPIDPGSPASRAGFIVGDCDVRFLLSTKGRHRTLKDALAEDGRDVPPTLLVDADAAAAAEASALAWSAVEAADELPAPFDGPETDLAYILYTSGSTGTPKGVMITHQAALTFVRWTHSHFAMTHEDVVSSHAPFHFDLSIFDIFTSISAGAGIVLIPEHLSGFPMGMVKLMKERGITAWYSVPSALVLLMTKARFLEDPPASLRLVLFAGEVFPPKYLCELRDGLTARMANLYGPTETNVCTYYEVDGPTDPEAPIPIGRAIANYDTFAVSDDGRLVGPGEAGQLMARGPGLMSGYWGQPERTAATIIQNPLHDLWYDPVCATGDLVQPHEDGDFRFIGRRDHMVKVRGYRIELGEVEAALLAHAAVHEAAAGVQGEGPDAKLVAWVAPKDGDTVEATQVIAHCRQRLSKYMVPESVAVLPSLPKTSNGKIDRQGLARGDTLPAP